MQFVENVQIGPSEISPNKPIQSKHMGSSLKAREQEVSRNQSPFKTRFVNTLGQERAPSPIKNVRDSSPRKISVKAQGNGLKHLT